MSLIIAGRELHGFDFSAESRAQLLNMGFSVVAVDEAFSVEKWRIVRDKRGQLISSCDWTQNPDSPLTAEQKTAWAEYRQALRDIPDVYDEPDDVVWPEKPTL